MKKHQRTLFYFAVSTLIVNTSGIPSSFSATKTQLFKPSKAGRVSTVVANTILNGKTPPKNSDGIAGDFYIDTKAMLFYGPKTKSHWPSPTSIRGPQGQTGANGTNSVSTKPSTNVVAVGTQGLTGSTGPKGEQGAQGIQGIAGPTGPKGEAGATGSPGASGGSGANGTQGPTGPQGPPGSPGSSGPQGAQGGSGAPGVTGATGATGAVGPSGPTGATGASGSSSVTYGPITFLSPIQGVVGTAQASSNFGSFEAGKSYLVRVQIQTFNVDRLITSYPVALDVSTPGGSPSRSVSYVVSNGSSYNSAVKRDEVSISAEIILDGSQEVSTYALSLTVTCGANTTSFPVSLIGKYHEILVGQVTQTS